MLDLKNIICLLPKTTSIESKYLSVNSILSELHNMLTKKADQDFIQSKLESQFHQIKKLREEFKTEYKQLLDGKDKEIKQLNKQLKEQRTETEKYRQKLDKQTVEYATDKQKLEQHEKTILENKSLIESLKREINDSLKCAEDAVCKQSILQSKLDDQTKLHKEKLKVKTDKLKEEIKRKKEKIKNLKEESKRQKEKAKRQKEESKREKEEAIIQMEKSRKQNDEDKKKKEEQQIIIMNLEDKLKDQTSIADKAKEDINFKEDFIKELNKDKDNLEKNIKDLNMKLNKDEKTIKDLEMELSKSGEDNKVLEERIKCIEKEDKKILAEQKDETDKINDQLNKNLKKLEILKQKYYNERYMMIPNLRYDIKELTSMKQTSNLLRYKFHLLLNHMTELDSSEDFKLIDSLFE